MTVELYFAYGPNLYSRQMATASCLREDPVPGEGGVADLVPEPTAQVWGALYELSTGDLDALDKHEGVSHAYKRERIQVVEADGDVCDPWTYLVANKSADVLPSGAYMHVIIEGARELGLPAEYIASLKAIACAPR